MIGIMRSRTGFRVILHSKNRQVAMVKGCNGAVVEVEMGDLHRVGGKCAGIKGKTVVLTGDLNLPNRAARMIETPMAVGKLEGASPHGQTQNLMSEADAEQGQG